MTKDQLETPAILLDLDIMENNLKAYGNMSKDKTKQLWPMIKTHKSSDLAFLQKEMGAGGFLCGTLDECEVLAQMGIENIMYAYPVAGEPNLSRVAALAKNPGFIIRIDNIPAAKALDAAAERSGAPINYTVIVDCGLHRFGVELQALQAFLEEMRSFKHLVFKGISTHPGQVYGASGPEGVITAAADEIACMEKAAEIVRRSGLKGEIVSSGSTPTYTHALESKTINIFHPGNYIFMDNIQITLGCAAEKDCALTVLATVVSNPKEDLYIIDAGSKCLGLDQGAHGNGGIQGFGLIKGHPELVLSSLSEEVGKIQAKSPTDLKVGTRIEIIPNHSCASANMTSHYIGCRGETVQKIYHVDMRGNATDKGFSL